MLDLLVVVLGGGQDLGHELGQRCVAVHYLNKRGKTHVNQTDAGYPQAPGYPECDFVQELARKKMPKVIHVL